MDKSGVLWHFYEVFSMMVTGRLWQGAFMFVDWNVEVEMTQNQGLDQTCVYQVHSPADVHTCHP